MKAPIILFAFNRPAALKACLGSLLANPEAAESDLVVFVDGPRPQREGERAKVEEVQRIVLSIRGFRSVETHFSEENKGLGPSVIAGVSDVLARYGRAIVVEDDLVASRNFLAFLNQGLDHYESVPGVFSICGYSNRVKQPDGYPYDAYFCPRSSSWGWATWRDRWEACDWQLNDWKTVKKQAKAFNRWGGSDCFNMLREWREGRNQSWAIRFCYNQFLRQAVSLFPTVSKIDNRGYDGDGTHCKGYNRFRFDWDDSNVRHFRLPETLAVDARFRREALKYHSIPIRAYSRIRNLVYRPKSHLPRILIFAPFPPPVHGAAVVSEQIRNSRLINEVFQCDYLNSSISRRVEEVNRFAVQKAFRHIGLFFRLFAKLIGHRYDLCYLALTCHGKSFLKDVPFALLCKIFVKKRVIHQHNKGMAQDVNRWPYRHLIPLVYRKTSVILLSWRLYPDIERVVPKERVWVCPNGTTMEASFEKERQNEIPHLLFLSNLIESKGVLVLLDALALLKEKKYSFHCDFVGAETREIDAGRWADEVRKRGLERYVCYQGPRMGEEKDAYFKNADIFVFPTYYECFPLVLLEAMSYGLPVVTTEEGGIPDMVEDGVNGIISERKNPQSLAIGIARLLDEPELRQKMGLAGRKRVEEHFTEGIFEKRLVEILQHLISAKGISLKTLKLVESRDTLKRIPEGKVLINTLNAHSYNMALEDEVFAQALQEGDYLIPDGMSIVKACKWLKAESRPKERIAGWDLFVFEMEKLNLRGGKCFFMGSSEAVLARIRERCAKDYPNIVVETYSPPYKPVFSAEEDKSIMEAINQADPDLLWIGLTAPKQEKWVFEHWSELKIRCHCGTVGAVFDFYAGTVKRAPLWMQKAGLEWFYRLVREPARMWRRYIIGNAKFIKNIFFSKFVCR